jgi:hypothetical protein
VLGRAPGQNPPAREATAVEDVEGDDVVGAAVVADVEHVLARREGQAIGLVKPSATTENAPERGSYR